MMGVYIKEGISRTEGKDMPENCLYDCRLVNSCLHVPRWADAETLDNLKVQRADNCTLVEVSEPHGRLIDADRLVNRLVFHTAITSDVKEAIEDLISEAPIIIDAKREATHDN